MSTSRLSPSRWMNWRATDQIIGDSAEGAPTKPSKPGSAGFVGLTREELPNIGVKSHSVEEAVREPERGIPWAEWKAAAALNHLFREQDVTGQRGRTTAAAVRDGEGGHERVDSAASNEQPMSRAEATE